MQPLKRRKVIRPGVAPGISIIVPVTSPAADLASCVTSLLHLDFPDCEILLSAPADDPFAVTAILEQEQRKPERIRALALALSASSNSKVDLLAAAVREARRELLLFTDDNVVSASTRVHGHLAVLEEGYSLVSAAALGVEPASFWGRVDAAFMNGYFSRLQLAGDMIGLSGVTGKTMLVRRRDLDRIGGLQTIGHGLCEDSELQKRISQVGGRTALSPEPVRQVIGRRTFGEVWNRHLRWFFCRRRQVPGVFVAEIVLSSWAAATAGALLAASLGAPWWAGLAATLCALFVVEAMFLYLARWHLGGLSPVVWLTREILVLPLCIMALTGRTVVWRTRRRALVA